MSRQKTPTRTVNNIKQHIKKETDQTPYMKAVNKQKKTQGEIHYIGENSKQTKTD